MAHDIKALQEDGRHPLLGARMTDTIFFVKQVRSSWRIYQIVGTSQAAKAASHDRILDTAAARIRRDGIDLAAFFAIAIPFRALIAWQYNRTGSLFLVGLLHAVGDATASQGFAAGFLPRLYENSDVGFFHMVVLALLGLVVIAVTRGRLGQSARQTPHADSRLAPVRSSA